MFRIFLVAGDPRHQLTVCNLRHVPGFARLFWVSIFYRAFQLVGANQTPSDFGLSVRSAHMPPKDSSQVGLLKASEKRIGKRR